MCLLVRKVKKAKWEYAKSFSVDEIPSDSITGGCLRTSKNTLSLWEINSKDELNEAVLAICSGMQHIEPIDLAMIPKEKLEDFDLTQTTGICFVDDLIDTHYDLENMTHKSLGGVAKIIRDLHSDDITRIDKNKIRDILILAIENKRLDIKALHKNVKEKLTPHLN
jgi:hypothetical protein